MKNDVIWLKRFSDFLDSRPREVISVEVFLIEYFIARTQHDSECTKITFLLDISGIYIVYWTVHVRFIPIDCPSNKVG